MIKAFQYLTILVSLVSTSFAQQATKNEVSKVWVSDQGNGTYKNPVLNADYSDPDAIRVGEDYYLTSSSFEHIPGLPILHSKDMVNWTLINHALKKQPPFNVFNKPQHGNGVWAPAIRYHNNEFYIYYPDPDYGIYMVKTKDPAKDWSTPLLVYPGKGIIDPCPFWDEDGKAWLTHAYAGSRAGIKSIISIAPMNTDGTEVTGESMVVYDGHETDPTIEGPKVYKRNNYYYLFAPAGGVSTGWQLVLRSKNILGPYERKVVMDEGKSEINGPHQGAWVSTPKGEDWFFHFQDKDAYGRVVHLQPMKWINDWPVIGLDKDGDGIGEPVLTYKKPAIGKTYPIQTPAESDEFNDKELGKQWQWEANWVGNWLMTANNGKLRLYAHATDSARNLWDVPNIIGQKFPADEFTATTKLKFTPNPNLKTKNEEAGLVILGLSYANLSIKSKTDGLYLVKGICEKADKGNPEIETIITKLNTAEVWLKVKVDKGAKCTFSYSLDGITYTEAIQNFQALPGKWVGAKIGLFSTGNTKINDTGYADFDWFRIDK
ncbi:glycoside hydrolase family 43 protein [Pedobacter cryophilus]|uniref:Glycosyl hydrolase 43 family protein n=1 Tax=Pedobacter cryophilus TaxID=2571271 RepID=A0A4U1C5E6_9SPHI|nr:glycoside hydrolase 43 family protein [Pedobacter cryophilus]TKC00505.1 glycosyl hydrolase 43 family protein [Pedobacter cryophilus]